MPPNWLAAADDDVFYLFLQKQNLSMDTGDLAADAEGSQAADTGVAALMPAGSEDCAEGQYSGSLMSRPGGMRGHYSRTR